MHPRDRKNETFDNLAAACPGLSKTLTLHTLMLARFLFLRGNCSLKFQHSAFFSTSKVTSTPSVLIFWHIT